MRKETVFTAVAVGAAIALIAPDAWATTGFQTVDQSINRGLTAVMGFGGAVGTAGIIEGVTGWRFGHHGVIQSGAKTGIAGAGIGGAGAMATTVIGSGTSFDGSMLPVDSLMPWLHAAMSLFW